MTAANESPEGLLLSLDTDKLRGTPTPQKENIPSFHDITLPGMEERGRTAGEGEERRRRRGVEEGVAQLVTAAVPSAPD